MTRKTLQDLSRRERQIMDAIYSLGEATAAEVRDRLPDAPTPNAVRRLIAILEEKDFVEHEWDGPRHVYRPLIAREQAGQSAITHLTRTFFEGSTRAAMVALLDQSKSDLSDEDLAALAALIDEARKQGR